MFLLNWWRQYLEIKYSYKEKQKELQFCESCESLKFQLSITNEEKKQLLDRLLEKPEPVIEQPASTREFKPILSRSGPWSVRRQMMEAEDRDKARKLKMEQDKNTDTNQGGTPLTVKEIEQELGVSDANS